MAGFGSQLSHASRSPESHTAAQGGTLWPQAPGQWPQPPLLPHHGTSGLLSQALGWSPDTAHELLLLFLTRILHLSFL